MYDYANSLPKNLEKYVRDQMLKALVDAVICIADGSSEGEIACKLDSGESFTKNEEEALIEAAKIVFPTWFNPAAIPQTFRGLCEMIASDEYFIPTVVQEYVLAHAIMVAAEIHVDEVKDGLNEPLIPKRERRRIRKKLAEDMFYRSKNTDEAISYDDALEFAEEDISGIEDFTGIIDLCFHDMDYELLDDYTPDELYESSIDSNMGVGIFEPACKRLPNGEYEDYGLPSSFKTIVMVK